MDETTLAVGAIFSTGIALAIPLGQAFGIRLDKGRYSHLDGLRAIAALLVVCSHSVPLIRLIVGDVPDTVFTKAMGAVGVQVFFAITGFLFARKAIAGPIDIPALISSRVRRIVPLYLLCATAAVIFAIYLSTTLLNPPSLQYKDVVKAYAFGFVGSPVTVAGVSLSQLIGQAWSLSWEWEFYVLVPFLTPIFTRTSWRYCALAFIAACAWYQFQEAEQFWVFFIPGIFAALIENRISLSRVARIIAFGLGIAAYGISLAIEAKLYGPARLILSTVGFSCLLYGYQGVLAMKPLRTLGEVSYSLYMLQMLIITGFWRIATDEFRDFFPTTPSKMLLAIAMLGAFFLLSFVTFAAIERPFMRRKPMKRESAACPATAGFLERVQ